MAQQREATTDRLVNIIARIKMERKSGQLRVKRGEGLTLEEGVLTFIQGQVTQASVGRRSGADALNWLCTWRQAHYVFTAPGSGEEGGLSMASSIFSPPGQKNSIHSELATTQIRRTDRLETEPLESLSREIPRISLEVHRALARFERSGLSRSHRRLFLLIDGHRSIDDLSSLMSKKSEDIRSMLHDLEWLGVVQVVSHAPEHPRDE
jgi:hypothetical protein